MTPPKIFLSYSRKDIADIEVIARTLMIHGIRTWQDITNLGTGLSENAIRKAIQQDCSGLLFHSTELSVESPTILQVELPEAERKHEKDPGFHIVPIFKLSINETNSALKCCLRIPISNFNGVELDHIAKSDNILEAAQKAAEIILKEIKLSKLDPLPIGWASQQETSVSVALDLNFIPFFSNGLPAQQVWNVEFSPALRHLKDMLIQKDIIVLRLHGFAHLSLGFLFGYIFRNRTGFNLEIEQITKNVRHIWSTKTTSEENPLLINEFPGDLDSKNLCVKINLRAKDDTSFCAYAKKTNFSYRALLELTPTLYPQVITNGQAITIDSELADKIQEMHGKYSTNTVHIFAAIPLGLALFMGYNLNACGKIQCYEFDRASRQYFPSCVLD